MNTKELTIQDLRNMLDAKEMTPEEVFNLYKNVIEKDDKEINAFLDVYNYEAPNPTIEDALRDIPCGIKDVIMIEGKKCTAGSKMLENYIATYDATTITKLKNAGVPFLGKCNLDEFTMGTTGEYSAFGATKNPLDITRVPGGSSSGSAAAVAGGMAPFTLGTDTGGSIRLPSAWCGVVGFKPTYSRVSRYGEIPMCSSTDQQGVIAKTVAEIALVLENIAGHDPRDANSSTRHVPHYIDELLMSVKGLKIAMPKEFFSKNNDPQIQKLVIDAVKKLEDLGASVQEVSMPMLDYGLAAYYILVPSEVSANMARYDGIRYGLSTNDEAKDLLDVYMSSRAKGLGAEVRRRIMLGTYALSAGYYDAYYKKAAKARTLLKQEFDRVFEKFDVIVGPTSSSFAPKIGQYNNPLDFYLADIYMVPSNLVGIPAISVPCGFGNVDGVDLPAGLHIMGRQFAESTVLQVAQAFETAHKEG